MRRALALTLALSAGVHTAALVALVAPRFSRGETSTRAPEEAPSADAPEPAAKGLSGETFELPAPDLADPVLGGARAVAPPDPPPEGPEPAKRPPSPPPPRAPARPTAEAHGQGTAGESRSAPYGAVGDRTATDLATAFTRGFPQAASADPIWQTTPLGPAGAVVLRVTIDEEGRLLGADVEGAAPPALAAGIRRTVALLRARRFTSRAPVTRLALEAAVTPDTVHDGLHGDVFAIGGSFAGAEGHAFFALATGRRIDLRVRFAR